MRPDFTVRATWSSGHKSCVRINSSAIGLIEGVWVCTQQRQVLPLSAQHNFKIEA